MLEGIKDNIVKLIALYEAEREEKDKLRSELVRCKAENETRGKRIEELEHQVDNLRLTEAFLTPAGSGSGAKERIEKLIKEIDKCISLLEN